VTSFVARKLNPSFLSIPSRLLICSYSYCSEYFIRTYKHTKNGLPSHCLSYNGQYYDNAKKHKKQTNMQTDRQREEDTLDAHMHSHCHAHKTLFTTNVVVKIYIYNFTTNENLTKLN